MWDLRDKERRPHKANNIHGYKKVYKMIVYKIQYKTTQDTLTETFS